MKRKTAAVLVIILLFTSVAFASAPEVCHIRAGLSDMPFEITWNSGEVVIGSGSVTLSLHIGSDKITAYGSEYALGQTAYLENNKTYVPTSSIALIKNLVLYYEAVTDAETAEESEILPLHAIAPDASEALVVTWHRYPDSYVEGAEYITKYGEVWVTTYAEAMEFAAENPLSDDIVTRYEQLLGLPPQNGYTHFSVLRVKTADLLRPSPGPNIYSETAGLEFDGSESTDYINWFEANIKSSYTPKSYPWTRLGYTYDWCDNGTEYGLSEYIIKKDSTVWVEETYTNEEFFEILKGEYYK